MWNFITTVWNAFIFEPIYSILAFLTELMPGNSFGLALLVFVCLLRLALYPVIKRQLIQVHKQREVQPELSKIKKMYKGDRQQEALAIMALYKEKGLNPFSLFGYLLIQIPIFIALYKALTKINESPSSLVENVDMTFFGLIDLSRPALETIKATNGQPETTVFYFAGFALLLATVAVQFLTSKQMSVDNSKSSGKSRNLRQIFKAQAEGEEVDRSEINQASSRLMIYIIPFITFFIFLGWFSALSFYWLVNGIMQYLHQRHILHRMQASKTSVKVNGKESQAIIEKPLNAKQKRQKRQQEARPQPRPYRRKRVKAQSRTINKKKSKR